MGFNFSVRDTSGSVNIHVYEKSKYEMLKKTIAYKMVSLSFIMCPVY
jgi:hypothetical protein